MNNLWNNIASSEGSAAFTSFLKVAVNTVENQLDKVLDVQPAEGDQSNKPKEDDFFSLMFNTPSKNNNENNVDVVLKPPTPTKKPKTNILPVKSQESKNKSGNAILSDSFQSVNFSAPGSNFNQQLDLLNKNEPMNKFVPITEDDFIDNHLRNTAIINHSKSTPVHTEAIAEPIKLIPEKESEKTAIFNEDLEAINNLNVDPNLSNLRSKLLQHSSSSEITLIQSNSPNKNAVDLIPVIQPIPLIATTSATISVTQFLPTIGKTVETITGTQPLSIIRKNHAIIPVTQPLPIIANIPITTSVINSGSKSLQIISNNDKMIPRTQPHPVIGKTDGIFPVAQPLSIIGNPDEIISPVPIIDQIDGILIPELFTIIGNTDAMISMTQTLPITGNHVNNVYTFLPVRIIILHLEN